MCSWIPTSLFPLVKRLQWIYAATTWQINPKASCVVATDTGFSTPAGAVALHRDTRHAWQVSAYSHLLLCFAAVPSGALPSHSPSPQLTGAAALRFLKAQFRIECYSSNVLMASKVVFAGNIATVEQGRLSLWCEFRMFPEDAESLECSFWPTSLLFPLPLHNLSSGSRCDKSDTYSEPPQGKPRLSWAGGWTEAALPGCQLVGQPEEAALILFPETEIRNSDCIGMTGCGKRGVRNHLEGVLQLALLEIWGTTASLWWEAQRVKAGQILKEEAEL